MITFSKLKRNFSDVGFALFQVAKHHAVDFLINALIARPLSKTIAAKTRPEKFTGTSKLITARWLAKMAPDGAFISGPIPQGFAKFAIRKGLPLTENGKTMAVENDPHLIDDFDGEIKEGYGKGMKNLLWSGNAIVKIGGEKYIGKVNIHEHLADRAGKHYDLVVEGVKPGTKQFEFKISEGEFKGRYAVLRPKGFEEGQVLITRMKDRSVVLAKPSFNLKSADLLKELDINPGDTIVEWKPDGSLANVYINDNQAIFRSHRETGEAYYDKLPGLEDIGNHSNLLTNRFLFPGPLLDGTLLRGELFHPEGAARVGGILNSSADKAVIYQQKHGNVIFYAWDIIKLKGKDLSGLPYKDRRAVLETTVNDIREFNRNWYVVPSVTKGIFRFYHGIVSDPRGLPWSEGVVIKRGSSQVGDTWYKVKHRDTVDVRVVSILEGAGKRAGHVGRMVVETAEGGRGEVGSFMIPDEQLKWIWDNRDILEGQVAEIYVQEITKSGAPRAGVFYRWHPSKSEAALLMYSLDDRETMFKLKSAAGWRRK